MITTGLAGLDGSTPDIVVIGSGPVGISLAFELQKLGRAVLLLESGENAVSADAQDLARAEIADEKFHVPMAIAVARRMGGTSELWGGRCVTMDPIDFERRPAIPHSGWPIGVGDVDPYLPGACDYIGCGTPVFSRLLPGMIESDPDFRFDRLERWSTRPRFRTAHAKALAEARHIDLRLRATVSGLEYAADGRVQTVRVTGADGDVITLNPRCVVLAAGGIENTRMLLASRESDPQRFGGEQGALGRYYMGHVYGASAEMVIDPPQLDAGIDYFQDDDGTYIRRRFTPSADVQRRLGLSNVSFMPDYPAIYDPVHRNGILSFAYLALSVGPVGRIMMAESIRRNYVGPGGKYARHMLNVLRELPQTASFMPVFMYRRYLAKPSMPGFFQRNKARRYAVRFHAEHLPNPDSRITLASERDAAGLRRVAIDLRYSRADAEPLIRTHDAFGAWLTRTKLGSLRWMVPEAERADHIIAQCYDGHHQIGTTRMGASPADGVVSRDCRVFGAENLFVAGCSVFPTSGAANPTLTAVALGLRLAQLLAREVAHA